MDPGKFSSIILRTKQKKNTDIREGDDTDFADLAQYFDGGGVFSVAMCAEMNNNPIPMTKASYDTIATLAPALFPNHRQVAAVHKRVKDAANMNKRGRLSGRGRGCGYLRCFLV